MQVDFTNISVMFLNISLYYYGNYVLNSVFLLGFYVDFLPGLFNHDGHHCHQYLSIRE